jgi:pseudaminic acid cytidylyltransferase
MRALGFVPARGGSKRIPGKNTKLFAGRPLIEWTLGAARESGVFAAVVVSTDDGAVREVSQGMGVEVDERPEDLAGDGVRFVEVLLEFLGRRGAEFDAVAVLLPTCPLRTAEDLWQARREFERDEGASVIAVSRYEFPPEFACDLAGVSGELTVRHPEVYARSTQSQSVRVSYHPNGFYYWSAVEAFRRSGSFFTGRLRGVEIPGERAVDLDYPHQWVVGEALAGQIL